MGCCCSSDNGPKRKSDRRQNYDKATATARRKPSASSTDQEQAEPSIMEEVRFVALWDYEKGSNPELSFCKGDIFKEVGYCEAGPDWLFVNQEGKDGKVLKTGYIPKNMVAAMGASLMTEDYFFGPIPREECEQLLRGKPDGTFLVRGSEDPDYGLPRYVLSVSYKNRVKHYQFGVKCEDDSLWLRAKRFTYVLAGKEFREVRDVIEWFRRSDESGVCCLLTNSPPRPPPKRSVLSADIEAHWREIPRKQIKIEKEIGKGFYGIVYKGIWNPKAKVRLPVAVKELKRGLAGGREQFLNEAVSMKNLAHPRLVQLLGIVSNEEPFWIVTEFIKDGALKTYLKRRAHAKQRLTEAQLIDIASQVASGMCYLEKNRVVHRDLAARNVLIQEVDANAKRDGGNKQSESECFDVRIADLGLAQMIKGRHKSWTETRSLNLLTKWTAPEALTRSVFSTASDVWSYGILLYEIFTHGSDPYPGMSTSETRKYVLQEKKKLEKPDEIPDRLYQLIMQCCEFEPRLRPSFADIRTYLKYYTVPREVDYIRPGH